MKFFILAYFVLAFIFGQDIYYSVKVGNSYTGYIQMRYSEVDYKKKPAYIRETWSVFNVANSKYIIDEKTIYERKNSNVLAYLLQYQKDLIGEQRQYFFSSNSVKVLSNATKPKTSSNLPLKSGAKITTNYFSLLPLFEKCKQFPLSFFVVEPKNITVESSRVSTTKMTIIPLGRRNIRIANKHYKSFAYQLIKKNASKLTFWLSIDKKKILKIKQHQKNSTIIELSDESIVTVVEKKEKNTSLPKIRKFPFETGKMYRYVTKMGTKKIGFLEFFVFFNKTTQVYEITAIGKLLQSGISFTSNTKYDKNLKPLSYELKQTNSNGEKNIESVCDFKAKGVKAHFRKGEQILDRLVPIASNYVFLDNNSYHHFAIFASQLPFSLTKKVSIDIFHPRRLQITKGLFVPLQKLKDGTYVFQFKTSFYDLKVWIDKQGRMVKYKQGNISAYLEQKKKK